MKKQDKRSPTSLQYAQAAEARAKGALVAAKRAYNEAKAAHEAICVVVTELESRSAQQFTDKVKCERCLAEAPINPFPEGWTQTGTAKSGGLASYCPKHS